MAMTLGMVGLGRMGANMAERLRRGGHTVVGYDRAPDSARDVDTLEGLVDKLPTPRVVWVMVPAGPPTYETIDALAKVLDAGDVVVDGGNSRYTDDIRHAEDLAAKGIGFVDCGVSGGVWGLTEGYALMCGGEAEHVSIVQPLFDTLKPEGAAGFVHAGSVGMPSPPTPARRRKVRMHPALTRPASSRNPPRQTPAGRARTACTFATCRWSTSAPTRRPSWSSRRE